MGCWEQTARGAAGIRSHLPGLRPEGHALPTVQDLRGRGQHTEALRGVRAQLRHQFRVPQAHNIVHVPVRDDLLRSDVGVEFGGCGMPVGFQKV
jgi:hypothetical protein